tara:strand:- start:886 stop:1485 length:600 start_codon:yes stop_codon:yes gene_type:complete
MKIFSIKDGLRGTDFVAEILPEENGLDPTKVKRCTHSNTPYLRRALEILQISNKDSILDIGCSKGAALYCMNKFPFSKIDGIEISSKLAFIAKNNFQTLAIKNIDIFNVDALECKKYIEYNIFYFYNSLFPDILKEVLEKIIDSNTSDEIFFIYNNPRYSFVFDELKLFLINDVQGNWDHRIYIYSNVKKPTRFDINKI